MIRGRKAKSALSPTWQQDFGQKAKAASLSSAGDGCAAVTGSSWFSGRAPCVSGWSPLRGTEAGWNTIMRSTYDNDLHVLCGASVANAGLARGSICEASCRQRTLRFRTVTDYMIFTNNGVLR